MPFDYIISDNGEYLIDENGNYIINGESDVTDISINYHTVISFPDDPISPITTGIEAGSLLVNNILYTKNIKVGEINSSRFEVVIYGIDDITGKKIYVYQQHNTNPTDIIPIFTGIVNSCQVDRNEYYRKIIAYDEFYTKGNLDVSSWWDTYWGSHGTGSTIQALRTALLSDATYGMTIAQDEVSTAFINDSVTVLQFAGVSGLKMGTLLSYIAEINGVNPYLDAKGELRFYNPRYSPDFTTHNIDGKYEGQSTDFEKFTVAAVDKVIILGEGNAESGRYIPTGSDEANVYVIKDNPLLYNIIPPEGSTQPQVYDSICENLYDILGYSWLAYTPAKIKMILANTQIKLGDYVNANIKSGLVYSLVTQVTRSGSLLIEQSFVSSGDEKLATVDYSPTAGQISEIRDWKVQEHFIWVEGDGAYVTTDATSAGVAPQNNFSKLTSKGLDVTASTKDVAFFGVIGDDDLPFTRLGLADSTRIEIDNDSLEMKTQHSDVFFHIGKSNSGTSIFHTDTLKQFMATVTAFDPNGTMTVEADTQYFDNTFSVKDVDSIGIAWGDSLQYGLISSYSTDPTVYTTGHIKIIFDASFVQSLINSSGYVGHELHTGDIVTLVYEGVFTYTTTVYYSTLIFGDHDDIDSNGDYSTVLGYKNSATGRYSTAIGWRNTVSGDNSFATGYGNTVSSDSGSALGTGLNSDSPAQTVVGKYNESVANSPFIVGDGRNSNNRHNALWIDANSNTHISGQLISPTIGSYWNMPDLKWNDINPQSGTGSGDTIELRAVGSNQQALALIDVNGNHHVLSDENGGFIPEKADTSALNAVVSALGSVTVAGEFSSLDVSVDEDLVDLEAGTYLILVDFHIDITVQTTADVMGSISICDSNNNYLDSMLTKSFYLPAPTGTIFPRQDLTMIAAVTTSATTSCHVEYREASSGVYSDAYIKVVYVKLK